MEDTPPLSAHERLRAACLLSLLDALEDGRWGPATLVARELRGDLRVGRWEWVRDTLAALDGLEGGALGDGARRLAG